MKILLVGGGEEASFLTASLAVRGHEVTIIHEDAEWCRTLSDIHKVFTLHGDGTEPGVLEDAGIRSMDIVIALGSKDAKNLTVCEIAKKQFNVKTTLAVVSDPKNIKIFKALGVDKCISTTQLIADVIEHEAAIENLKSYFPIENGRVRVCEIEVDERSPVLSKKLWEIVFPKDSIVGCIIRAEKIIIPQGDAELKAGDKVIVLSSPESLEKTVLLLTGMKRK